MGQTKLLTVLHILHLSGYLCWDMKRRKGHGKIRHSRTETSSQLAWKPVTKHCGKIQTRSWGEAASKSWHHLRSLRNSALRQLNDILELITGFQMTMNSCPVCKAICIWVKCRFGKSGSPISTNACSKGKHPTAQGLPSRACFWEIGKQATASTNPRLSFSLLVIYYFCDVLLQHQEPHSSLRCPWAQGELLTLPSSSISLSTGQFGEQSATQEQHSGEEALWFWLHSTVSQEFSRRHPKAG